MDKKKIGIIQGFADACIDVTAENRNGFSVGYKMNGYKVLIRSGSFHTEEYSHQRLTQYVD